MKKGQQHGSQSQSSRVDGANLSPSQQQVHVAQQKQQQVNNDNNRRNFVFHNEQQQVHTNRHNVHQQSQQPHQQHQVNSGNNNNNNNNSSSTTTTTSPMVTSQQQPKRKHFTMHVQDPKNRKSYSTPLSGSAQDLSFTTSSEWKRGGKRIELSREDIERYVHLPQPEAADALGVSLSTLKRRYYELGMGRWSAPNSAESEEEHSLNTTLKQQSHHNSVTSSPAMLSHVLSNRDRGENSHSSRHSLYKMSIPFLLSAQSSDEKFIDTETYSTLHYRFQTVSQNRYPA